MFAKEKDKNLKSRRALVAALCYGHRNLSERMTIPFRACYSCDIIIKHSHQTGSNEEGERVNMFNKKPEKKSYDKLNLKPVLRCSICTGEQVAGFKNLATGKFEEVMLIRNDEELNHFKQMYDINTITKEY